MAIAVRSVKAGMTRFGYLRSRLKDGAKLGCRGAAIGPPTRTPARSACRFRCIRRTKPYTGTTSTTGVQNLAHQVIPLKPILNPFHIRQLMRYPFMAVDTGFTVLNGLIVHFPCDGFLCSKVHVFEVMTVTTLL